MTGPSPQTQDISQTDYDNEDGGNRKETSGTAVVALSGDQADHNATHIDDINSDNSTKPWRTFWVTVAFRSPYLSGLTAPFSLLISISGISHAWRRMVDDEGNNTYDPKPKWVIAVTCISLGFELVGNIALFLNFYGRVLSYTHAIFTSITAFSLKVLLLLPCIIVFRVLYPNPGQIFYSQGYWLTTASIVLTTFTLVLLLLNYIGYTKKYYQQFDISLKQRLLMLQSMALLFWLALGALTYTFTESIPYPKSLYFVVVTILTIGFGDISPQTTLGRALLFPYAFIGILFLGLVIGSFRSVVLEETRERILHRHIERYSQKHSSDRNNILLEKALKGDEDAQYTLRQEFHDRRRREKREEKAKQYMSAFASVAAFAVFWLVGAAIFSATEDWTYFEAFYFCFVSLLTIGYGEYTVTSDPGRTIFILWSILSIPLITIAVSYISDTFISAAQKSIKRRLQQNGKDPKPVDKNKGKSKGKESERTFERSIDEQAPQHSGDEEMGVGKYENEMEKPGSLFESNADACSLLDIARKEVKRAESISKKILDFANNLNKPQRPYTFEEYLELSRLTNEKHDLTKSVKEEELMFIKGYAKAFRALSIKLGLVMDRLEDTLPQETGSAALELKPREESTLKVQ